MQFLVVCGGAGHGLIGKVPNMDGELLIDVYQNNEYIINNLQCLPPNLHRIDLDRIHPSAQQENSLFYFFKIKLITQLNLFPETPNRNLIEEIHHYNHGVSNFAFGLSQSPTLGGFLIRHPEIQEKVDRTIRQMSRNMDDIHGEEDVTVWIVASTAGGTGEGINRFVAERFIHCFAENGLQNHFKIVFLRVGPATYQSCANRNTGLNSFYAIAHDNAFSANMRDKYGLNFSVQHIYLDLPDVGGGPATKLFRSKMIALTCGQLIHEFNEFHPIIENNVELFRVGLWMDNIPEQKKYLDALKALQMRLSAIIAEKIDEKNNKFLLPIYRQQEGLIELRLEILDELLSFCENFAKMATIPDFMDDFKRTLEIIINKAKLLFMFDDDGDYFQLQVENPDNINEEFISSWSQTFSATSLLKTSSGL